jgi:hypothetical protein
MVVLVLRRQAAARLGYARRHGRLPHRRFAIAGEQADPAAQGLQPAHQLARLLAQDVAETEAGQPALRIGQCHRRVACVGRFPDRRRHRQAMAGAGEVRAAQAQSAASDAALHSLAGGGLQHLRHRQLIRRETGRAQRCADGVLRALLQRRRPAQRLVGREISNHHDPFEAQPAPGQRAGLVENEMIGARQGLDGMAARHQQAEAREGAGGHRQRRRRRQRQRAGAAHHQHRDEHPQQRARVDQVPGDAGGERQQQQGGDEPGGDPVGLLISRKRPLSRKKTNIVTESK